MGSVLACVTCLVALLASTTGRAKGEQYLIGATIQGGELSAPRHITIRLPDGYDDMAEIPDVEWWDGVLHRAPDAAAGEALACVIVLHYDFERYGYGRHDWAGRFDGHELLYFREAMVVGPGVWQAGWYRANPLLAEALQGDTASTTSPPFQFVVAGALVLMAGVVLSRILRGRG